jgi:DNA-directed RNA polymerase subunit H (RpoH/RPB5)
MDKKQILHEFNPLARVFNSRKYILEIFGDQNYNVDVYKHFGINEINIMMNKKQLDMLLLHQDANKIYIRYELDKTLRPIQLEGIVNELFRDEDAILKKSDTLFIITNDDPNETLRNELENLWQKEQIFIVVTSIARLQFNIFKNVLVPKQEIITDPKEVDEIKRKYNIDSMEEFPIISRFDAVAQLLCLRPGMLCKSIRPSPTAITSVFYRLCVNSMQIV